MSVEFIELADRVLRCEVTPDGPGVARRTLRVEVASGAPLTEEEARRAVTSVVAELVARGCVVYGWAVIPDDPTG